MKTDKVSFGTRPRISEINAMSGLPKYKLALTDGILSAFEKLSQNGVDDVLELAISPKFDAKRRTTDVLKLSYLKDKAVQSSVVLSPRRLQNLSPSRISKLIISAYNEMKSSKSKVISTATNAYGTPSKTPEKLASQIQVLLKKFGSDDAVWS